MNPKKILIADDNEDTRNILTAVLQREGYEITLASDGIEALRKVSEETPDLILLDVMMPGKNGWEVCAALKSDAKASRIYIIMISTYSDQLSKERGFRAGANEYITKPIKPSELLRRLRIFLGPPLLADTN